MNHVSVLVFFWNLNKIYTSIATLLVNLAHAQEGLAPGNFSVWKGGVHNSFPHECIPVLSVREHKRFLWIIALDRQSNAMKLMRHEVQVITEETLPEEKAGKIRLAVPRAHFSSILGRFLISLDIFRIFLSSSPITLFKNFNSLTCFAARLCLFVWFMEPSFATFFCVANLPTHILLFYFAFRPIGQ